MQRPLCDFCCSRQDGDEVRWRYPAKSFAASYYSSSIGDWAACNTCHDLIENDKFDELADRSFQMLCQNDKFTYPNAVKDKLRELHKLFVQNRTGPCIKA